MRSAVKSDSRAFTLVELLIVVAIIIILISLLIVAVARAGKTAGSANTGALLNSIKQGLIQFKEELGYYPPVLDHNRALRPLPTDPLNGNPTAYQDYLNGIGGSLNNGWYSETSLAEYLLGYGQQNQDGNNGPGIRDPGLDAVWGATSVSSAGLLTNRSPVTTGKVYGPYIDTKVERSIAGGIVDVNGALVAVYPGEAGYTDQLPKVIVDHWGQPIRYYRKAYPPGSIKYGYRLIDRNGDNVADRVPTLSEVFLLRPFEIKSGAESDSYGDRSTIVTGGDTTTSRALDAGEFALFSAGPDKLFDATMRVDVNERNRDNIVEVGP